MASERCVVPKNVEPFGDPNGVRAACTIENKLYYIENTVGERHCEISGYFSDLEKAKAALKQCNDWYRPKGTGKIYSVNLDVLNDKPKLEYKA